MFELWQGLMRAIMVVKWGLHLSYGKVNEERPKVATSSTKIVGNEGCVSIGFTDSIHMQNTTTPMYEPFKVADETSKDYEVWLTLDYVHEVNDIMKNSLYRYFIGKMLAFPVVECYLLSSFGLETSPGASDVSPGTSVALTAALAVPANSPKVSTAVPADSPNIPAGVSSKGKYPMVEEDIPVKARTFRQMEEDRLGEEAAKRLHDEEMAHMKRESAEAQRKRQQEVIESAIPNGCVDQAEKTSSG
nr:sm-like protein LSM7 [Tanacetum cinerariifolium]